MKLVGRLACFAFVGGMIGLAVAYSNGTLWRSPAGTAAGSAAYVVGLAMPMAVVSGLLGLVTRKKPRK